MYDMHIWLRQERDFFILHLQVHYAATIAGMAFANAFLGVCHSMAHKIGAEFHIPHGLANAALISHVIRYNATDVPFKQVHEIPRRPGNVRTLSSDCPKLVPNRLDDSKVLSAGSSELTDASPCIL